MGILKIEKVNSRCSGAALNEFALVLPLLVIFLAGLLELGRAINQMAWLSQTSYEAVRAAGNTAGPQGHDAVQNVGNLYYSLFAKDMKGDPSNLQGQYLPDRMVKVTLEDQVSLVMGSFPIDVRFELTGAHLATPAPNLSTEYSNGATIYNCHGQVVPNGDGSPYCCLGSGCQGPGGDGGGPNCKYFSSAAACQERDEERDGKVLDWFDSLREDDDPGRPPSDGGTHDIGQGAGRP